jgi:YD repeat-containing protein
MLKQLPKILSIFFIPSLIQNVIAEEYYWEVQPEIYYWPEPPKKYRSPELACRDFHASTEYNWMDYDSAVTSSSDDQWYCYFMYDPHPDEDKFGFSINRYGDSCTNDKVFNKLTGQCEIQSIDSTCPSNIAGNPIDLISGYKIQSEQDLPTRYKDNNIVAIKLARYYSSANGLWTHSYSSRLQFEPDVVRLIHADGKRSYFDKTDDIYTARPPAKGKLRKSDNNWIYDSGDNFRYEFDILGNLSKLQKHGSTLSISYADKKISVKDDFENSLHIVEDEKKQPLQIETRDIEIHYNYNSYKQLTSMHATIQGQSKKREYLYEDSRDNRLLTGIIDERGIRYAKWTYDEQGRATSSEHPEGVGKTSIRYNTDGSSTVTNELGQKTHYQFEVIHGIKRIKSINGSPSANCSDSNSTFTYDDLGHLQSKTDNNGNLTTYVHNEQGLEVSRTEASGTSASKTIVTEWHPTMFLPITVTEPTRQTRYTYDTQGRQLRKTITSR